MTKTKSRKEIIFLIHSILETSDLIEDDGVCFLDDNLGFNGDYTATEVRKIAQTALENALDDISSITASVTFDASGLRLIDVNGMTNDDPPKFFRTTVEYPLGLLPEHHKHS